jgi:hypothetical protein
VEELHKRVLRIHLGLVLAEILCVAGFAVELSRALSGNSLSWAYVFEWPLFGGYALYMWRRFIVEEKKGDVALPEEATSKAAPPSEVATDGALDDYNEYLRRVHEEKPTEAHRH